MKMLVFEILGFLWNFKPKNEGYQSISVKMTLGHKIRKFNHSSRIRGQK